MFLSHVSLLVFNFTFNNMPPSTIIFKIQIAIGHISFSSCTSGPQMTVAINATVQFNGEEHSFCVIIIIIPFYLSVIFM